MILSDSESAKNAAQESLLQRARVVLHNTTHSGNIGSAARAMKTMGLSRLYLSAPQAMIDSAARAMSAGAIDVLAQANVCETLPEALSDCSRVFAFTARLRDFSPPLTNVREAGILAAQTAAAGGEVAFLFGGERSGLTNEDVRRATHIAAIPSSPSYWSLNLAQAVQVASYELRQAAILLHGESAGKKRNKKKESLPPTQEQLDRLMEHCREFLSDINMPKRGDGALLAARLRRLLTRAEPDAAEVRMLRGVLRAARRRIGEVIQ